MNTTMPTVTDADVIAMRQRVRKWELLTRLDALANELSLLGAATRDRDAYALASVVLTLNPIDVSEGGERIEPLLSPDELRTRLDRAELALTGDVTTDADIECSRVDCFASDDAANTYTGEAV